MTEVTLQSRLALRPDTDVAMMSAFVRKNSRQLRAAGLLGVVQRYGVPLVAAKQASEWRSAAIDARLQPFFVRADARIVGIGSILPALELLEPTVPVVARLPRVLQKRIPFAQQVRIPADESVNISMFVQNDADGATGTAAVKELTDIAADHFAGRTAWALVALDANAPDNNREASYLRNGYAIEDASRFDDREPRMWTLPVMNLVTKSL
jgi:hypothetical protein